MPSEATLAPDLRPPASSHTVGDLTEAELIARIREQLPVAPDWMTVGIGDDAAVVEPARNRLEVLTVDAIVEGVHFDRAFVPPDAIGHRALAVNLSDLAAMGAEPRLALWSMALPPTLPVDDFDQIVSGFVRLAGRHRLHLAGGNLTRSPGPLMIDVTLLGTVKRRQPLTRAGAKPGDELYVSGTIGAAAAGLQMLRESVEHAATDPCIERYLRPEPRVRAGVLIARNRAATACMDLSDGLADAVHHVARASGVGVVLDAEALPIAAGARRWFIARGLDPTTEAVGGGDDYELLVAVRPRRSRRFLAAAARDSVPFTRIGTCTDQSPIVLRHASGGAPTEEPLLHKGYHHFR